jgi:hypothetical protein
MCEPQPLTEEKCVVAYAKATHKSEPVTNSIVTMCNNGHKLCFSSFCYIAGDYSCNKCSKPGDCKAGRWFCLACEYDICQECRPAPENLAEDARMCDKSHFMTFSMIPYQSGEYYRCSTCYKAKLASNGRWWCPICSYDVCEVCSQKSKAEEEKYPPAIETANRRCKDKHQFKKVHDKDTMFTCQQEDKEIEQPAVKCRCVKCGMVQCLGCAQKSGIFLDELPVPPKLAKVGEVGFEYEVIEPTEGSTVVFKDLQN